MEQRYVDLRERFTQLEQSLQDPEVTRDAARLQSLGKEYAALKPTVELVDRLARCQQRIIEARQAAAGDDEELAELANEELPALEGEERALVAQLTEALRERDPLDAKNLIIEIRAGVGGDEAALFAADLFRVYARYAERQGWTTALLASDRTGIGGLKNVTFQVRGDGAYGRLKYESGVHRVQRVPETEKSGRIHTSTATVAVLAEPEALDIVLKPEDLKIEATTAGGHGGQSVNTTYSAIRMTHLPTGITVSCQDERSQKQNKERALQIMRARLFALEQERRHRERAEARKSQVGSGDRSEKIRTYNIPQDRVTDHRTKTQYGVAHVLDGDLDQIINDLLEAAHRS